MLQRPNMGGGGSEILALHLDIRLIILSKPLKLSFIPSFTRELSVEHSPRAGRYSEHWGQNSEHNRQTTSSDGLTFWWQRQSTRWQWSSSEEGRCQGGEGGCEETGLVGDGLVQTDGPCPWTRRACPCTLCWNALSPPCMPGTSSLSPPSPD